MRAFIESLTSRSPWCLDYAHGSRQNSGESPGADRQLIKAYTGTEQASFSVWPGLLSSSLSSVSRKGQEKWAIFNLYIGKQSRGFLFPKKKKLQIILQRKPSPPEALMVRNQKQTCFSGRWLSVKPSSLTVFISGSLNKISFKMYFSYISPLNYWLVCRLVFV